MLYICKILFSFPKMLDEQFLWNVMSDKLSSLKPNTTINITAPAPTPSDKDLTPRLWLLQNKVHFSLLSSAIAHSHPPRPVQDRPSSS